MKEIWKDIEGYEGLYQVSNLGNVKSLEKTSKNRWGQYCKNEKILKPLILTKGYLSVFLYTTTTKTNKKIHRLVAQAFLPNPDNLPQVNHKDEDKTNNVVWINEDGSIDYEKKNLEWCTNEYNSNYGTRKKRVSIKLTNGKKSKPVLQYDLKGNFIKEWPSVMEIKRQLGFSNGNIAECCRGKYNNIYGYIWRYKGSVN